jgi:hypothetical protein
MGEKIAVSTFHREPGHLYYVKEDENGFLSIYKAAMARGGKKKVEKKKAEKVEDTQEITQEITQ